MTKIFDGHNDVLSKLAGEGGVGAVDSFTTGRDGAIDLPKARKGEFAGGFFAVYVPSPDDFSDYFEKMHAPSYDIPLPPAIARDVAVEAVTEQAAILFELERRGALNVCRTTDDIRAAMEAGRIAAIFHIEGAEAIGAGLHMLDVLYAAGLRSLGPVWSRPTIFGEGVPFRFPSTGDTGGGLTEAGIALVRRCDALGIMLDLSHLNEAGFWDVARHSNRPLVATHSNAHSLCNHARNLTDAQLDAIAASGGVVGLNFAVSFLREDGGKFADTPLDTMLRHLDHLLEKLGEDGVALGSDYDGAVVPNAIATVADLPELVAAMRDHGLGDTLIEKICSENWLTVLDKCWRPARA